MINELSPFVYLVLALGSVVIAGGLLVWVLGYVRRTGHKRTPPSGEQPPDRGPTSAGDQELLRVSRIGKGGFAVFVQGKRYRHLQEISDPQVGRETIEALKAVLTFAEGWLPALGPAPPQPAPWRPAAEERASPQRPRLGDLFPLGSRSGPPQPEPLVPVEQIDELVQERLQERPGLAGRRISLTTDAGGDLCIYVDEKTFEAVDDVPEPEVQALIRDAIREWEERYAGPGKHK